MSRRTSFFLLAALAASLVPVSSLSSVSASDQPGRARIAADGGTSVRSISTAQVGIASVQPGAGPSGTIRSIASLSDGRIVIGGSFTSYNGLDWTNLAIINADGSLDPSFARSTFDSQGKLMGGSNWDVYSVAVQSVGGVDKILVSTGFRAKFNCDTCSAASSRLMRLNLDGTVDTSFNTGGSGPDGGSSFNNITAIQQQSNGKLLIAGDFTSYNGTSTAGVAILNADGTLATAVPSISGGNNVNRAIATSGGTVYFGPGCTGSLNNCAIGGFYSLRTASLATPATVVIGSSFGTSSAISNFTPTTDGGMVVVGEFGSRFGGVGTTGTGADTRGKCIGKLDSTGALVTEFNSTSNAGEYLASCDSTESGLSAAVEDSNKNIIFGGYFAGAHQLARFNEAGTDLTVMAQLTASPAVLATQTVGATNYVIAGGAFTGSAGKLLRYNIATGVIDATFPAANNSYMTALGYQNADASSASSIAATVGTAVTISPVLTPSTGVGSATYSLTSSSTLPGGLSLDPNTGIISGTTTTAGYSHVYVAATSALSRVTTYLYFNISSASSGSGGGPRPTTTTTSTVAPTTTTGTSTTPSTGSGSTSTPQSDEALTAFYTSAIPGVTKTDTKVYTTPPQEVAANSSINVLTPTQKITMDLVSRTPNVCLPNDDDLVFLNEGQCTSAVVNAKTRSVLRTLRTKVVGTNITKLRVGNAVATIAPIYFDYVSSKLNRKALSRVKKIRSQIASAGSVLVIGHSGTLNGNSPANIQLSKDRATNVVKALQRAGSKGPFAISGVGASAPTSPGKTLATQAKNRRVIIVLVP